MPSRKFVACCPHCGQVITYFNKRRATKAEYEALDEKIKPDPK
jgi:hypothetical protein